MRSARGQLVQQVQTLERLEAEKHRAAEAFRDALDHAKRLGYDPATLKIVLRLRKLTPEQRKERRALEAIYLAALGMLEGDPLSDEARRRLDEDPAPLASRAPEKGPGPPSFPPPPQQQPMNMKDPEEARREGRAAAGAGKRIYDNPYPAGDPCRAAWDEGWCETKKSNGMDTPAAYKRRSEPSGKGDKEEKGAA